MALKMPGPIALASGVYHLNVRVPSDLIRKLRGTRVTLPVEGAFVAVKIGDKVIFSLRTREVKAAKERFSVAFAALQRHWETARGKPGALTHKQIVALAGEAYRRRAEKFEEDFDPDVLEAARFKNAEAIASWQYGDGEDDAGELSPESARFFAAIQRPFGPQLLALETGGDIESLYVSITLDEALEDLFGEEADALLAEQQVIVLPETRTKLLREIGRAVRLVGGRLVRQAEGDYASDANLARFPAFEATGTAPTRKPAYRGSKITVEILFERWLAHHASLTAVSTGRRYTPSINSLAAFLKGKDIRHIDQDDIWSWAEHRRDKEKVAAKTVNRNDLVAAASLFNFAATRDSDVKPSGEKKRALRGDNPVRGVKLPLPKVTGKKDKTFKAADIKAILTLARSVEISGLYPKAAASRRWAPWICAYSGARIQEVCWLKKEHIWREGGDAGIWVMEFPMTKDGFARTVPLHDALIDEGFIDYWKTCGNGFLFVGDVARTRDAKMSAQKLRAGDIARWIRKKVDLEEHLSPNHSWRHTFITKADGRMTKRMANRLAGHNKKKDASDGYYSPSVDEMKAALDAYLRYVL